MSGCREEPTIVIKFEPNDLSAKASVRDSATSATAAAGDSGSAATPDAAADKPAPGKGGVAECKQASDCTLVPAECCGCNNGGAQQAIAKTKQFAQQAAWKARCGKKMCPMVMSNDPSCAQTAACVDGSCVLTGGFKSATKKKK
jgi:hypothetical protein